MKLLSFSIILSVFTACIIAVIVNCSTSTQLANRIIREQQIVIDMQNTLIDDMANHAMKCHDCDSPVLDSDMPILIGDLNTEIDSLIKKYK